MSKDAAGLAKTKNLINHQAFDFLSKCDGAQMDWTVAQPLSSEIMPPPYVHDIKESELMTDLSQYRKIGGSKVLMDAAQAYFAKQGIKCTSENIVIGNGIFGIFGNLCNLLNIRDNQQQVLLITPAFGYFHKYCHDNGIGNDFVETIKDNDWWLNTEMLNQKLKDNSKIKILLLNYPNNPTGKIMDKKMALDIAEVMMRHPDVLIISDEILTDMEYGDKKSFSIASIEALKDRVMVLNSPAKSRGLAGTNTAFAYLPDNIAQSYRQARFQNVPSTTMQKIVAESLQDNQRNQDYLTGSIEQYKKNILCIKEVIDMFNKTLNVHFKEEDEVYVKPYIENPESGNAYLLDFSGLKEKLCNGRLLSTGLDVAQLLLDKSSIGVVPGECFFIPEQDMAVRISSAISTQEIQIGFERITKMVKENFINAPTQGSSSSFSSISSSYSSSSSSQSNHERTESKTEPTEKKRVRVDSPSDDKQRAIKVRDPSPNPANAELLQYSSSSSKEQDDNKTPTR